MKKLILLIVMLATACSNVVEKVYEPLTYRTDWAEINKNSPVYAEKIAFVVSTETPKLGATYQDLINRYPLLLEEIRIKDSIALEDKRRDDSLHNARVNELLLEQEKALLEYDTQKKIRDKRRADAAKRWKKKQEEHRNIQHKDREDFIKVLDDWGVKDVHKKLAIERYDNKLKDYIFIYDTHFVRLNALKATAQGGTKLTIEVEMLLDDKYEFMVYINAYI